MSDETPLIDVNDRLRLLGTAHIATASVEAVMEQIATYQPDIVAVELCQSRYETLISDRRLDKEGLLKVVKEGKAPMVLLQSMLSAEQRKLGLDEGQQPGAELLAAVNIGKEAGCEIALVDRDIQVTLRRAWRKMKFREKWRLLTSLLEDDDDEDEVKAVITNENKSQFEYVTVNIKDKIAVKVADPLGPRATGVGCAMWKSSTGESGRCAWNSKGQCFCPAPE